VRDELLSPPDLKEAAMHGDSRGPIPTLTGFALVLALLTPLGAAAQSNAFVGIGAGAGVPTGASADAMGSGWLTEAMAGLVLPNGRVTLRVGGMYGQTSLRGADPMGDAGGMGPTGGMGSTDDGPGTPTSTHLLGAMAGVMAMPAWDWDWYPYVHAGAGALRARYDGSATSFAWSAGAGTTLKSRALDFYIEGRYLQARRGGETGAMVSATTGLRFPL
jgi:hypothetical protein